jgi:hypothetical protein
MDDQLLVEIECGAAPNRHRRVEPIYIRISKMLVPEMQQRRRTLTSTCWAAAHAANGARLHHLHLIAYVNGTQTDVYEDVPFNAANGEVVQTPKIAHIRTLPSHSFRLRLLSARECSERVIGDYTFKHVACP